MPRLILACLALLALALMPVVSTLAEEDVEPKQDEPITPDKPIDLFNGKDLSNWEYDIWIIGESVEVNDAEKRTKDRQTINYTDGSEKELGEWNTLIVQARCDTVKVFINGDLVNEVWDCSASSGAICLQAEGTPIKYRKVQLRPLPKE